MGAIVSGKLASTLGRLVPEFRADRDGPQRLTDALWTGGAGVGQSPANRRDDHGIGACVDRTIPLAKKVARLTSPLGQPGI